MLGKAMRIATMCTLAFAICGEREKAAEKEEEKTSRRWLAKSLLLGASVHAASGFGQPAHSARGFGRPARFRALEPLKGWSPEMPSDAELWAELWKFEVREDDVREFQQWQEKAQEHYMAYPELRKPDDIRAMESLKDAMNDPVTLEIAKSDAREDHVREFQQWHENAQERYLAYPELRTPVGIRLMDSLKDAMMDPVTWEIAKRDAEEVKKREFQQWQEKAQERYLAYPELRTPDGIRAMESLKDAMNDPVTLEIAKRDAEKEKPDAGKEGEFLTGFLAAIHKYRGALVTKLLADPSPLVEVVPSMS